ncbi:MAG: GNAT family protein [Candidatus Eisenbacteria bacterium]
MDRLDPVVLAGRFVRLVPLSLAHVDGLAEVVLDPELWQWTLSQVRNRAELEDYVQHAIHSWETGHGLPFATIEQSSGRIVGSTRFGAWAPEHRRVEIGWTTVARPWQRTSVNTEAKLLMMTHAFERLGCNRVELKTDAQNRQSRQAILRIGAREEGELRQHAVTASGQIRGTVYYSVLADEWPAVKTRLEGSWVSAADRSGREMGGRPSSAT